MREERESPPGQKAGGGRDGGERKPFSYESIAPQAASVKVCSTAPQAWAWVQEVAAVALDGDVDACRCLPAAVEHYLAALREGTARC